MSDGSKAPGRTNESSPPERAIRLMDGSREGIGLGVREGHPPVAKLSRPAASTDGAVDAVGAAIDRSIHYAVSRITFGLSPSAMLTAYYDWLFHVLASPGKQMALLRLGADNWLRLARYAATCAGPRRDGAEPCVVPPHKDNRFAAAEWQTYPFNLIHQAFLLNEQWWHAATTNVRGVDGAHERVVEFTARQLLDMMSPSNFLATNPEVLRKTFDEGGQNLIRGTANFFEDWERTLTGEKPEALQAFRPGEEVAATPGKVVYRNELIELLQYAPSTDKVHPEPILFVPAWIMKYYILDLSQKNSLVRYLRDQGFTVFMISWKNPDAGDRDLGMEDYVNLGIMSALNAINAIVPGQKVHCAGYCLGGTLLSLAAAAMNRDNDDRLQSLSLFAAQVDFTEAGELTLFTSEAQIAFLEDMMAEEGFLDARHMAGAFQMLRSSDLVWSRVIHEYLMGERQQPFDLLAWNADTTRMPARMHAEYLRKLFLDNDLAEERFYVNGRPTALSDIKQPVFVVGTETDHVSPWRSVFKMTHLAGAPTTFVLTNGGHNAGIVSEPGHRRRAYRVATRSPNEHFVDPDRWLEETPARPGSWWPEWAMWLAERSGPVQSPPRVGLKGSELQQNAPGSYVLQS